MHAQGPVTLLGFGERRTTIQRHGRDIILYKIIDKGDNYSRDALYKYNVFELKKNANHHNFLCDPIDKTLYTTCIDPNQHLGSLSTTRRDVRKKRRKSSVLHQASHQFSADFDACNDVFDTIRSRTDAIRTYSE